MTSYFSDLVNYEILKKMAVGSKLLLPEDLQIEAVKRFLELKHASNIKVR